MFSDVPDCIAPAGFLLRASLGELGLADRVEAIRSGAVCSQSARKGAALNKPAS
jgi:hypothetical protein